MRLSAKCIGLTTLILTLISACDDENSGSTTNTVISGDLIEAIQSPAVDHENYTPVYQFPLSSLRILYVGNSYLAYNPTIDGAITRMGSYHQINSLIDLAVTTTNSKLNTIGGGTLEQHWELGNGPDTARGNIESGEFDLLIMQGRYDVHEAPEKAERFDAYADLFSNLAKQHNMKTVLFGLWATDSQISPKGDKFGPVAHDIYRSAAERNAISYAPNGMAYNTLYTRLADIISEDEIEDLMTADKIHPNPPLAYLAANVMFYTLFGTHSPTLEKYRPTGLTDDLGVLITNVAQEAVINHGFSWYQTGK